MKKIFLLILYLLFPFVVFSQTENLLAQIHQQLEPSKQDSEKSPLNFKLANFYLDKNLDSAYFYYEKALENAYSTKFKDSIATMLIKLGKKYADNNSLDKAIKTYLNAGLIFNKINNSAKTAKVYRLLAFVYDQLNDEREAMNYNVRSLNIYKGIDDQKGIADNLNDIGNLYYTQENYTTANSYYNEALTIYTNLNDKNGQAISYTNLGNSISDSGNLKAGLDYYFKSQCLLTDSNYELEIATNYNNIGDTYNKMGLFTKAEIYFTRSLTTAKSKNNIDLQAIVYMNLAENYNKQQKYIKAIQYGHKSLAFSEKLGDLKYQLEDLKLLEISYENLNDVTTALSISKKYAKISDSLLTRDRVKKVQLMNVVKELNNNESTIEQLANSTKIATAKYESNQILLAVFMIGFTLVTLLVLALVWIQKKKLKTLKLLEFKNFQIIKMKEEIELQRDNLEQMNATKDKLFSIIGHDLKNPFNSIKGFSELIIENYDDFDEQKKIRFLKIIKGSAIKATNLLDNLLVWAQSQSSSMSFSLEKLELKDAVINVISLIEIQAANKEIQIINEITDSIFVSANKNMLQTILRNLISNAIKFTENGGKIYLTSVSNENFAEISVRDTGVGMSITQLKSLFKNKLNDTNLGTANEEGTGLGLTLCKDFVEKLGGVILVKSKLEQGSEFIFTIPIWSSKEENSAENNKETLIKYLN